MPHWYINLYIYELALERTAESAFRGRRGISDVWDKADEIWDSIKDFFQDTVKSVEEVLADIGDLMESIVANRCRNWYQNQLSNPPVIDVPSCPCTTDQLQLEAATFEPDPACSNGNGCSLHPGAHHCVRSRFPRLVICDTKYQVP